MLAVAKYSQDHVDQSRARIEADTASFAELAWSADDELAGFASVFFITMVLVLDHSFLDRGRTSRARTATPSTMRASSATPSPTTTA